MARSSVVALLAAFALAACPGAAIAGGTAHAPIAIGADGDFGSCHCVVSGSGSSSDPYVIGPWSITNANGDAVRIDGTQLTKSFVLRNLSVNGNGRDGISIANVNPSGSPGIVAQVSGSQTTANNDTWGVQVTNSSHVTLDGVGLNRKGPGVAANGFATANTNRLGGIDLEHSSDITVRGWQMNANGSDAAPDWISLDPSVDYWSGGGMRLFDVSSSTIDHNSANNSVDGHYMLFDSSRNMISNNTGGYPFTMNFLLADGSSYNSLVGNEAWDGDFQGVLVADPLPGEATLTQYGPSHDNSISHNFIHSNGPTGGELHAGVVPAFLGGIVLLNGTYANRVTDNQTYASTGTDLGWSQAVADPGTAAGVVIYPPVLGCNVTAYDGPKLSQPPLNDNVWSGNTFKVKDACIPAQ